MRTSTCRRSASWPRMSRANKRRSIMRAGARCCCSCWTRTRCGTAKCWTAAAATCRSASWPAARASATSSRRSLSPACRSSTRPGARGARPSRHVGAVWRQAILSDARGPRPWLPVCVSPASARNSTRHLLHFWLDAVMHMHARRWREGSARSHECSCLAVQGTACI